MVEKNAGVSVALLEISSGSQARRGKDREAWPETACGLSRQKGTSKKDVGRLHARGLPRAMEPGRSNMGLSLPRFALQPDGQGRRWTGGNTANSGLI